jgi:hypothetical protein
VLVEQRATVLLQPHLMGARVRQQYVAIKRAVAIIQAATTAAHKRRAYELQLCRVLLQSKAEAAGRLQARVRQQAQHRAYLSTLEEACHPVASALEDGAEAGSKCTRCPISPDSSLKSSRWQEEGVRGAGGGSGGVGLPPLPPLPLKHFGLVQAPGLGAGAFGSPLKPLEPAPSPRGAGVGRTTRECRIPAAGDNDPDIGTPRSGVRKGQGEGNGQEESVYCSPGGSEFSYSEVMHPKAVVKTIDGFLLSPRDHVQVALQTHTPCVYACEVCVCVCLCVYVFVCTYTDTRTVARVQVAQRRRRAEIEQLMYDLEMLRVEKEMLLHEIQTKDDEHTKELAEMTAVVEQLTTELHNAAVNAGRGSFQQPAVENESGEARRELERRLQEQEEINAALLEDLAAAETAQDSLQLLNEALQRSSEELQRSNEELQARAAANDSADAHAVRLQSLVVPLLQLQRDIDAACTHAREATSAGKAEDAASVAVAAAREELLEERDRVNAGSYRGMPASASHLYQRLPFIPARCTSALIYLCPVLQLCVSVVPDATPKIRSLPPAIPGFTRTVPYTASSRVCGGQGDGRACGAGDPKATTGSSSAAAAACSGGIVNRCRAVADGGCPER